MRKIVNKLINKAIEGADVYHHNGNLWLIFTDRREWILELSKDGRLWYKWQFFENLFKYVSLDVNKNHNYITKWFEDTIPNMIRFTEIQGATYLIDVEDTIRNGVKFTDSFTTNNTNTVEDIIQNGVKYIMKTDSPRSQFQIEDAIQNGVKYLLDSDTLKTNHSINIIYKFGIKDDVENGLKIN